MWLYIYYMMNNKINIIEKTYNEASIYRFFGMPAYRIPISINDFRLRKHLKEQNGFAVPKRSVKLYLLKMRAYGKQINAVYYIINNNQAYRLTITTTAGYEIEQDSRYNDFPYHLL